MTTKTATTRPQYKCGHESRLADYRRGKVRAGIVARVESRNCPVCAAKKLATQLTRIDGSPYTPAEQAAYVARHTPRVY